MTDIIPWLAVTQGLLWIVVVAMWVTRPAAPRPAAEIRAVASGRGVRPDTHPGGWNDPRENDPPTLRSNRPIGFGR